jgi:hypothetical protein
MQKEETCPQKIQNFIKIAVFITLFVGSFWLIYTIDFKGDSKDMTEATKKMTNFTISDMVNSTLDAGSTIKSKVMEKFD